MIQALQSLLGLAQTLAGGGAASPDQVKLLIQAAMAVIGGYLAAVQPAGGGAAGATVIPPAGPIEPADPNDPNSSAGFAPVTVPIPYARVAEAIKTIAAQTQNEQWAAGAATMASLLSMIGGGA
jgi:hypothetical protein